MDHQLAPDPPVPVPSPKFHPLEQSASPAEPMLSLAMCSRGVNTLNPQRSNRMSKTGNPVIDDLVDQIVHRLLPLVNIAEVKEATFSLICPTGFSENQLGGLTCASVKAVAQIGVLILSVRIWEGDIWVTCHRPQTQGCPFPPLA